MPPKPSHPVHFVGSESYLPFFSPPSPNLNSPANLPGLPLLTPPSVFTFLPTALPSDSLPRIPDGEPGRRGNFTAWQFEVLGSQGLGPALTSSANPGIEWTQAQVAELTASVPETLETGYDAAALESWSAFAKASNDGSAPELERTRFQVGIPTPTNFVTFGIQPAFQPLVEPRYAAGLARAIEKIQRGIPYERLAVQIDMAVEFSLLHGKGAWYNDRTMVGQRIVPLASDRNVSPTMDVLVDKVVALADTVAEDVELGFHCCYGDVGGRHFFEPPDAGMVAAFMLRVLCSLGRRVDWIHFPVPKERTDVEYLLPLKALLERLDERTQVFVGLVHAGDYEGTMRRIEAAKEVFGRRNFGISTECGLGRRGKEELGSVLEIMSRVCRE